MISRHMLFIYFLFDYKYKKINNLNYKSMFLDIDKQIFDKWNPSKFGKQYLLSVQSESIQVKDYKLKNFKVSNNSH